MIINNKDIALYNATLTSSVFSSSSYNISKEWLTASVKPIITSKQFTYGNGTLNFLVEGATEDILKKNISNLVADISDSIIKFDDEFFYKVTLNSTNEDEIFLNSITNLYAKNIKITLTVDELFKDYIQVELKPNMDIVLEGNKASECIVEITPTQAMVDLIINGFSKEPIKINNLAKDVKVIINGEDKTIIANNTNKFGETEMWEFPTLVPGNNTITFSKTYFTGILKYKPRFV